MDNTPGKNCRMCCMPSPPVAVQASNWNGFQKQAFTLEGRPCFVVVPEIAAPGKPWVWRTSFPDYHPEIDIELLNNGSHVGYIDCVDMLGADCALDLMDKFYNLVRRQWGLADKPAMEAVSRGGLHAYRYAARHPERIACIYADVPVMDLKSWPLKRPGTGKEVQDAQTYYGFKSEQDLKDYKGNPLDLLPIIAKAKIPLRHVISLDDQSVPPEENTLEAQRRLRTLGHDMEIVAVNTGDPACNGHHFPLPEVLASAGFIMKHAYVVAT